MSTTNPMLELCALRVLTMNLLAVLEQTAPGLVERVDAGCAFMAGKIAGDMVAADAGDPPISWADAGARARAIIGEAMGSNAGAPPH